MCLNAEMHSCKETAGSCLSRMTNLVAEYQSTYRSSSCLWERLLGLFLADRSRSQSGD